MLRLSSAVTTHPGQRREKNEDAYCVRADLGFYMVADGMGGHAAGEIASRLAVEVAEAFLDDTREPDVNRTWPVLYDPSISLDANRLRSALRLANRRLASRMETDEALRGMATTAAAVLFGAGTPVMAHVGDSRIYRWRRGELRQLTDDHSWVHEQVRAGVLSETDARRHPWRNVVTRALSGGEDPEIDVSDVDVEPGDRLLLCSDGLSGVVSHQDLEAILAAQESLDETCGALVDAANRAGGPDNVTVVMLQVDVE